MMLFNRKWSTSRRLALVLLALAIFWVDRGAILSEPLAIALMALLYGALIFCACVLEFLNALAVKMERAADVVWTKNLYRHFFLPCMLGSAALFCLVIVDRYSFSPEDAVSPILAQRVMCRDTSGSKRHSRRIVPEKSGKFCFGVEESVPSMVSMAADKVASSLGKKIAHHYEIVRLPKKLAINVGMDQSVSINAIRKRSLFGSYVIATQVTPINR